PADRRDVRAAGGEDRPAYGRQVPRPAEHPARSHAQAAMSLATGTATPEVSVLVPAKDEAENLPEFVRQAREALLPLPYSCEVVIIDDGSRDATPDTLRELATKHPFVRVVTHRSQRGIAAAQGFRLAERPVPLLPRRAGKSKFGIARIPVGVLDLVSVWFQLRFGRKPLLFFGVPGAVLIFLGFLVAVYALIERYGYQQGNRAFLYLVLLLVLAGLMLFGFGF